MHLESERDFKPVAGCLLGAIPWTAYEQAENAEERSEAWSQCADLARSDSILELLDRQLTELGARRRATQRKTYVLRRDLAPARAASFRCD